MLTGFGTGLASISDGVGDAGAPTDIERVVLRDGSSVVIRPLAVGDEAAIASWFAGLGAETRYARLFVLLARLDRRTQSGLARVDHFNHEAIAAVAADGTTVGIARYLRTGKCGSAEVAVAVADDWRGRGIARMLLERIATRARCAGIAAIHRDVSCYQSRGHSPAEPARTDDGRPVRRRGSGRPDRSDEHTSRSFRSRPGERRSARLSEGAAMSEEASNVSAHGCSPRPPIASRCACTCPSRAVRSPGSLARSRTPRRCSARSISCGWSPMRSSAM